MTQKKRIIQYFFSQIGLYSRGKSHVLRMSVAVELLLSMCADEEEEDNSVNTSQNPNPETSEVDAEQTSTSSQENDRMEENDEETNQNPNTDRLRTVGPQAINVAYSIVNACLSQLCEYNSSIQQSFQSNKTFIYYNIIQHDLQK